MMGMLSILLLAVCHSVCGERAQLLFEKLLIDSKRGQGPGVRGQSGVVGATPGDMGNYRDNARVLRPSELQLLLALLYVVFLLFAPARKCSKLCDTKIVPPAGQWRRKMRHAVQPGHGEGVDSGS